MHPTPSASAGKGMPGKFLIIHRVLLTLAGTYAFAWGFAALGMALLVAAGMGFHDAETAMLLLAFLIFVPLFLWAFACRSLARIWIVLGGGAALMTGAAWLLQRALL